MMTISASECLLSVGRVLDPYGLIPSQNLTKTSHEEDRSQ